MMATSDILMILLAIVNTPAFGGILVWIIKVEKRLMKIETTCYLKNNICDSESK